jgi:hypothetical protein
MIVPIAFDSGLEHARLFPLIQGLPVAVEREPNALADAKPSNAIVGRIENAATFRAPEARLVRHSWFSALLALASARRPGGSAGCECLDPGRDGTEGRGRADCDREAGRKARIRGGRKRAGRNARSAEPGRNKQRSHAKQPSSRSPGPACSGSSTRDRENSTP